MGNSCASQGRFDYELEEELGKGAFGVVYKAHDPNDEASLVVVKLVSKDKKRVYDMELSGAKILSSLDHDHIVQMFERFDTSESLYLVMEFVDGQELMQAKDDVTVRKCNQIMSQMLEALSYMHGRNVVHRDIKAENIMIDDSGDVKVIDFGLAATLSVPMMFGKDQLSDTVGTPPYVAPEIWAIWCQKEDKFISGADAMPSHYGPKVDVYASGVLIYLCLMGAYPHNVRQVKGKNMTQISVEFAKKTLGQEPSYTPVDEYENNKSLQPAIEFLKLTLDANPITRPDAQAALESKWFSPKTTRGIGNLRIPAEVRQKAIAEAKVFGSMRLGMDSIME